MRNALQTNRARAQPSTTAGETVELQGVFRLDIQVLAETWVRSPLVTGWWRSFSWLGQRHVSCPLDRPAGTLPPGIFLCCQPAGPLNGTARDRLAFFGKVVLHVCSNCCESASRPVGRIE